MMDSNKRIIVNTTAQYAKALINIGLSLYSTRLILDALQVSDFGIYAVVGGFVAMLCFITNALVVTTQRYISYHFGHGDYTYLGKLFSNSLLLHVAFGLFIAVVLVMVKGLLFGGVLNIPVARIDTAVKVYFIAIAMLFITIVSAPYKALFIARENIVYISVVEVCDGIVKLLFAILLAYVSADRLLVYALMMCFIQLLNFLAFALYAKMRFAECRLTIHRRDISKPILRQLTGFATWSIYGAGALVARNQGVIVIINHFVGTLANAAYGIAAQVNAAIFFVSSSIVNAMNPQIMKAEGEGDRKRMLMLAGKESKFSAILLSLASIPLLVELPSILAVWLKVVPENTTMFCTFTLATCLVDQFTIGLNAANQAQGRIGVYTLLMFTPKLLCLPIGWWLLDNGHSLESVMWVIIIIEAVVAAMRLPYLRVTAGLDIADYLRQTVLPILPLIATLLLFSWGCTRVMHFPFRFVVTVMLSVLVGLAVAWKLSLNKGERQYVAYLFKARMKR